MHQLHTWCPSTNDTFRQVVSLLPIRCFFRRFPPPMHNNSNTKRNSGSPGIPRAIKHNAVRRSTSSHEGQSHHGSVDNNEISVRQIDVRLQSSPQTQNSGKDKARYGDLVDLLYCSIAVVAWSFATARRISQRNCTLAAGTSF